MVLVGSGFEVPRIHLAIIQIVVLVQSTGQFHFAEEFEEFCTVSSNTGDEEKKNIT